MTFLLIVGLIKKTLYKMSQYFPKPYEPFAGNINVRVDLSNYATKADIKNITHINTSSFELKTNLSNLKSEVDKLNVDKLNPIPTDLSKLSDVVKNDVKKTDYNKLVTKVDNIDTSGLVKKTDYNTKISEIEDKILDTSSFVKKTDYNTKFTETEDKIPDTSNLATKTALTIVENKIPDTSNLATKTALTTVENKISDISKLDSDINFFQNISSLDTQYFNIDDAKIFVNNNISSDSFSVFHINIRSMQKNFEKFQEFFKSLKFNFSVICLSETWCYAIDSTKNSNYRLHGYKSFHQTRDGHKGGGLCIFLRNTLSYKIRSNLNMNSDATECLCFQISTKTSKNLILSLNHLPPNGDSTLFEKHMKSILSKNKATKKEVILIDDFNINLLDFGKNKRVLSFVNLMFRFGMIPTINKSIHVTRHTATAIDHVFTNTIMDNIEIKTAIVKTDTSDHFPIIFATKNKIDSEITEQCIFKRNISDQSIGKFKQKLRNID